MTGCTMRPRIVRSRRRIAGQHFNHRKFTMFWILSGITIAAIAAGIGAALRHRMARGTIPPASAPTEERPANGVSPEASAKKADGTGLDDAALERSRLIIHAMIADVSSSVESLHGDSERYGDALSQHYASIQRAKTIAGIREVERLLLLELERMQGANDEYKRKLDDANTQLKAQQQELERLESEAGHDFLTRLPNRRTLDERLAAEVERVKRYGGTFSILVVDIDHFKQVNDTHGHLAGDRILRAVGHLMDQQKRASDFLGRFGGEEFVFLLPETGADSARMLAEKIRGKVGDSKLRYEQKKLRITISAGVAEFLPNSDSAKTLLARADEALYRAKELGRNRVELATGSA